MTPPPADYCELCDLPLSQCIHGRPPEPPPEKKPAPRRTTSTTTRSTTPRSTAARSVAAKPDLKVTARPSRRTPQQHFRPVILGILQDRGGQAEAEDLFAELEERMELRETDYETVNQGEPRWRYAARRERKAMLDDGLMVPAPRPGIWALSDDGRAAPRS